MTKQQTNEKEKTYIKHGYLARLEQTLVNTHLLATSRLCVYVCVCVLIHM
jgi:hypothetical protein